MTATAATPLTVQIDTSDRCALTVDGEHRALLVIDWRDRSVGTEIRHSSQNTVTEYEWHGHQSAYALPANTDPVALRALVEDVLAPHILAICTAYDELDLSPREQVSLGSEVDGDVSAMERVLEELYYAGRHDVTLHDGGYWEASDWLANSSDADLRVTASTTDEEIEARAAELVAEARAEWVVIEQADVVAELERRRDDLADD